MAVLAASTVLLNILTSTIALVAASILAGMARGIFTLIQATAIADRWGTGAYGRLTELLSAPLTVMSAVAPYTGAALAWLAGGYAPAFIVLGALAATAVPVFSFWRGRSSIQYYVRGQAVCQQHSPVHQDDGGPLSAKGIDFRPRGAPDVAVAGRTGPFPQHCLRMASRGLV
jgi:MFS family permease